MDPQNSRWTHAIKTEEKVRMSWYLKNRALLQSLAEVPFKKKVDFAEIENLKATEKEIYKERQLFPKKPSTDPENEPVKELADIMKPVPPEITRLIYHSRNKGRETYLKERVNTIPEDRYVYPVCTSYQYGWKMWECAKTMGGTKVGKSAIVKNTFYRRRTGIERDPDWYTVPERTSPTICNCV